MRRVLVSEIQALVASRYGIRLRDMSSRRRWVEYVKPRRVAMYLARQHTAMSYPQIGARFNRDHSTVMEGIRAIAEAREGDAVLDAEIRGLEQEILG